MSRSRRCTTFRVGGPAELFVETRTSDEIVHGAAAGACGRRAGDAAGRRLERAVSDAGVRGLVIRPRGGAIAPLDPSQGARRRGGDHQRPGPLDDHARRGGPRSVGGHAGHGRRRRVRQRALRRTADRRPDRRGAPRRAATGRRAIIRRRRWRSATIAAACRTPARCCCRRRSASNPAIRRRCGGRRASRWRIESARSRSTRRARAASFRIRSPVATSCPTAFRGRPARSSIAPA